MDLTMTTDKHLSGHVSPPSPSDVGCHRWKRRTRGSFVGGSDSPPLSEKPTSNPGPNERIPVYLGPSSTLSDLPEVRGGEKKEKRREEKCDNLCRVLLSTFVSSDPVGGSFLVLCKIEGSNGDLVLF